jgi:apolipoprotein D and lipocalin family protein
MLTFLLGSFLVLAHAGGPALEPVKRVDLEKYLGRWIEVARIANDFQDDIERDGSGFSVCRHTTAEYSRLADGRVGVQNTCIRLKGQERMVTVARAKARVVDGSNGSRLKVNFTGLAILEKLGIGDGDYWVLELGPVGVDGLYTYALVGEPGLKYAWILSRNNPLPSPIVRRLVDRLERDGFDTRRLVFSQPFKR